MASISNISNKNIYKAALDNSDYGILLGNDSGIVIFANKTMLMMPGYNSEELAGQNISMLFTPGELD